MTAQISKSEQDERGLLPYPVIIAATKGDPEAMNIVVQHYESYIASLSMRKLRDERGNIYWGIDEDALSFPLHRGAVLLRHRSAPLWPAPAAARQSVPPAFVHLGRPIRSPFLQCLPTYPRLFPQYPPHRNMLRPSRQQPAFPRPAPPLWLAATPLSPRPWEHGRHPLFSAFLQPASV